MIFFIRFRRKERFSRLPRKTLGSACLAAWMIGSAFAQIVSGTVDLTEMSLEELMKIEVSLVSKKPERLSETAAAVTLLTQEDIRRSGVTCIQDALRLVPGFQVGRIDANKWAISARGFNDIFANKLLVLIDGRSVYSPIFSGVLWESQNICLKDVDRIEVIRGPGATLWGANAVNGVINIVTKNAQDTQGGMVQAGFGSEEKGFGGIRYGGKIGKNTAYRFYIKREERDAAIYAQYPTETDAHFVNHVRSADGWSDAQGGFRIDWEGRLNQSVTVQGDLYGGKVSQSIYFPIIQIRGMQFDSRFSGGNVLSRWRRIVSGTSEMIFQIYADRVVRKDTVLIGGSYNTYDADFQHRFNIHRNHSLIWGIGYRLTADRMDETQYVSCDPLNRKYNVFSGFLQDEISFLNNRFRIVLGSKFEHNDYTHFEFQPGFRILWKFKEGQSVWGAVSRAVRTPSRMDHDIRFLLVQGNRDFRSEELNAFELGSHHQVSSSFYCDLSAFYNRYNRLRSFEPLVLGNKRMARTFGLETSADWHPFNRLRICGNYSYLQIKINLDKNSLDYSKKVAEGESPRHQFVIRSLLELSGKMDWDFSFRYVDRLPSETLKVPAYFEADMRVGWRPVNRFEFSIVGQNLLRSAHPEFTGNWFLFAPTQVQRSVYGSLVWMFE